MNVCVSYYNSKLARRLSLFGALFPFKNLTICFLNYQHFFYNVRLWSRLTGQEEAAAGSGGGCSLPKLDPWDPGILEYVEEFPEVRRRKWKDSCHSIKICIRVPMHDLNYYARSTPKSQKKFLFKIIFFLDCLQKYTKVPPVYFQKLSSN